MKLVGNRGLHSFYVRANITPLCYADDPRCEEPAAYVVKLRSESVMQTFLCVRHAAEVRRDWPDDIEWIRISL